MATGQPPYSEYKDAIAIMIKIGKSTKPPPIPEQIQSLQARDFLSKCLQIDPKQRATADELLKHSFLEEPKQNSLLKKTSSYTFNQKQVQTYNYQVKNSFLLDAENQDQQIEPVSPQFQGQQGQSTTETNQIKVKKKKEKLQYQLVIEPEQNDYILTGQETNVVENRNKFQFSEVNLKENYIKPFNKEKQDNLQNELDLILGQYSLDKNKFQQLFQNIIKLFLLLYLSNQIVIVFKSIFANCYYLMLSNHNIIFSYI